MPILPPCWPQKTSQNNLDNFKIRDAQIFMIDIFDGYIDVAIIICINDMGVHPVIAFNDFQAKLIANLQAFFIIGQKIGLKY